MKLFLVTYGNKKIVYRVIRLLEYHNIITSHYTIRNENILEEKEQNR